MEETENKDEFVVIREGEDEVEKNPDDSTLAEELQIQEVIIFCIESRKIPEEQEQGANDPIDPKGKKSETTFYITELGESSNSKSNQETGESSNSKTNLETGESSNSKTNQETGESSNSKTNQETGESSNSKTNQEKGESSISKTNQKTFYCTICMERNPTLETFVINPCDHIFCNACVTQYITAKVGENTTSIHCPYPGCESGFLDPLACQLILPSDVFERWNLVLCESLWGLNKIYCPFKDCSALLVVDESDEGVGIINTECPHCHRMFCARCKVAWHGDMSCEEFEKLGKDERETGDLMLRNLAKSSKWQRCPQCRMYVDKIDGCMFMKCRCGYCFCYVCASSMSSETHYCKKCLR